MASRLLLVRHADTGPKYKGRYLGKTNVPLAAGSFEQAHALAPMLRTFSVGCCWSSPMRRALQTAQAATEGLDLSLQIDDDLREVDMGYWEGKTFAEIAADWPKEVHAWSELSDDFQFPGGEVVGGFLARVRAAADRLAALDCPVALAISHGGVIRTMICYLLGLEFKSYLLFKIKTASITVIDLFGPEAAAAGQRGILSGLNLEPHGNSQ
ncbi:MAG: Phosphoserine phosphatase 1 [Planctomycetes bacterium ADurb.Bin126]|nr:MAG: Phosphoserine phosphatase 1 [Planctomycetes bacterium ADurb.Bin126]HOD80515.1 histidine phosphatase family protein [Phycisphaerae bacterium]HQL72127.1 histidine phosphatase family protein [Phycisphaerae bacterium]